MIRELSIKNLALIDELTISFGQGFSVFTGETGAGKSILVGAISLLLGDRASAESIRSGCTDAEITGVFELRSKTGPLRTLIADAAITIEDNTLIIRRILTRNGPNRIYINQAPVPLSTLKSIGDHLIDFHGQHEHQSLLKHETAGTIINTLPDVSPAWKTYCSLFTEYTDAKNALEVFDRQAADLKQKRDLLEFQYNELAAMHFGPDEENELEQEFTMLSSVTERLACISDIQSLIQGSDAALPLERQLNRIRKDLETLQKFDPGAAQWVHEIETTATLLSELNRFCSSYASDTETTADPGRLEQINARLAKIQRLKRKYNCSFSDCMTMQEELKKKIDAIDSCDADRKILEKRVHQAETRCREQAGKLSNARLKAALAFDKGITRQMETLGFSGGSLKTVFITEPGLSANGLENAAFEVRTNTGEPFLPLIKTASGGEISRIMLAVKTVLAGQDAIPVLIFDEIDAGIGGLLATQVAASLYALSKSHQVICISHLHQIASCADQHYKVFKTFEHDRTITRVQQLNEQEKIDEISRMLGSDSAISKKHAQEILTKKNMKPGLQK